MTFEHTDHSGTDIICHDCGHIRETTEKYPTLASCEDCGGYDVEYVEMPTPPNYGEFTAAAPDERECDECGKTFDPDAPTDILCLSCLIDWACDDQ